MTTNELNHLSSFINLESFERFKEHFIHEIGVLDKYSYYCLCLAVFHDSRTKSRNILSQNVYNVKDISDFTELIKRKLQDEREVTHKEILSDFDIFCNFISINTTDVS